MNTPFTNRKEAKGYTDDYGRDWYITSLQARRLETPAQELVDKILAVNDITPRFDSSSWQKLKNLAQQIKNL